MGNVKVQVTYSDLDAVVTAFRSSVLKVEPTVKQSIYEVILRLPNKPDCTSELTIANLANGVKEATFTPCETDAVHVPWTYRWGGVLGPKLTE